MNIAIVGATGNVGRKIIEVLEQKQFPVKNLYLLASKKSSGRELTFNKKKIKVEILEDFDFSKVEITFLTLKFALHGQVFLGTSLKYQCIS